MIVSTTLFVYALGLLSSLVAGEETGSGKHQAAWFNNQNPYGGAPNPAGGPQMGPMQGPGGAFPNFGGMAGARPPFRGGFPGRPGNNFYNSNPNPAYGMPPNFGFAAMKGADQVDAESVKEAQEDRSFGGWGLGGGWGGCGCGGGWGGFGGGWGGFGGGCGCGCGGGGWGGWGGNCCCNPCWGGFGGGWW